MLGEGQKFLKFITLIRVHKVSKMLSLRAIFSKNFSRGSIPPDPPSVVQSHVRSSAFLPLRELHACSLQYTLPCFCCWQPDKATENSFISSSTSVWAKYTSLWLKKRIQYFILGAITALFKHVPYYIMCTMLHHTQATRLICYFFKSYLMWLANSFTHQLMG